MKAIILAAGRGTRISRHLSGNPKCTVDIGGTTLIRYTIKLLQENGITDIAIILGYRSEVIIKELEDFNITYFYNPFFDVTNSIASMWFAKEFLSDDDFLIMNGDVYIEKPILQIIESEKKEFLLLSDETRITEADYKLKYNDGILEKYGKELSEDDTTGEYVGIAIIRKEAIPKFRKELDSLINKQKHNLWWENILYELSNEIKIYVRDVEKNFWAEVDYIEDFDRIISHRFNMNDSENAK